MVESFARLLVRRPVAWAVVVASVVVAVVCGVLAAGVEQDDDVLAFLPPDNPDIQAFRRINERFGSTDVALVGIRTEDPFAPAFVEALVELTRTLRDTPGLDSALTLANVSDFVEDPDGGGIVTSELVREVPRDAAASAALREKVMSRDHIVGTLISEDADAVLVYAFGAPGSQPREVAGRVRAAVEKHFPDADVYWGGAPFISTWIYETTQADMAMLTPWAIGVIIVVMMIAFRDLLGTFLGLLATAVGIAVSRALMVVLGVSFNIVLSSMPIILFAVGSAYAIHMLSHYDAHARVVGRNPEAVVRTLVGTGPTVVAAGLTTVAGLASFVMMDIEPMRTFGVFTAVGLAVALLLSLTFVPAVISLFPRPVQNHTGGPLLPAMRAVAHAARSHRVPAFVALLAVVGVGMTFAGRVDARMDLRAFFDAGTEPYVAQDFLDREFGGSQFVQIQVEADLDEPGVLREIGRINDRIRRLPHVSDVRGVEDVMAIINDAMSGARRVPDTRGQASVLYRFLSADPAVKQLVTDDRKDALVQVKIGSSEFADLEAVLEGVLAIVREDAVTGYRVVARDDDPDAVRLRLRGVLVEAVLGLSHVYGVPLPDDARARIERVLDGPETLAPPGIVAERLEALLDSDENWVELPPGPVRPLADAVAALGPDASPGAIEVALAGVLGVEPDAGTVQDLLVVLDQPRQDAWRAANARASADRLLEALAAPVPDTARGERYRAAVASALEDRNAPDALLPSDAPDASRITWTVNGMPVLYRGLSRSVTANQFKSLGFALGLVFLIMTVYYRSPFTGMLATAPTFLTLVVVYGAMGAMGVHLDIGTSMLASIILGAGVDYAVHLLAGWHASEGADMLDAASAAVGETSHAIWTNAIMVAAGFFVLTLGDAKPLQNVGGLTAAAMLVAALSTFAVVPLFANKRRYRDTPPLLQKDG